MIEDMKISFWIFLPLLGAIVGAIIGGVEYKRYNRRKKE